MEPVVLKSNKGVNDKVFFGGFSYLKDGANKDRTKIYYACVNYKELNCRGRLVQDVSKPEDEQITVKNDHNHLPNPNRVGVAVAVNELKRKATESLEPPRNLISKVVKHMDVATSAAMPSSSSLRKIVNRQRKDSDVSSLPKNVLDLVVPEKYRSFNGEQFLLYDSGAEEQRILIFATEDNLRWFKRSDMILMDGTFGVVPHLFAQLYTFQGKSPSL